MKNKQSPQTSLIDVHGEPSYRIKSSRVEAFLTKRAGHLAPIHFTLGRRTVSPCSLSPWLPSECPKGTPPILQVLRGDFFCLPFGDDPSAPPVHGETANRSWRAEEISETRLRVSLRQKNGARIEKIITIDDATAAVYQEHKISNLDGDFNFGHHTVLEFPEKEGPFLVNVSRFKFGQVQPAPFTNPAIGEYSTLKTGGRIRSLQRVPLATGGWTSLHEYPAREGFEDLIMLTSRPGDFAWTAVTFDRYIWLQLKDPRMLPSTLFWLSNGGRHYPPWNGRHRRRLGLEEVCSHFNDGLTISREDRLKKEKIPTTRRFHPDIPTSIRLIHVAHPVPRAFGMVVDVKREGAGTVRVRGASGREVSVPVAWEHLYDKSPGPGERRG